MKNVQPDIVNMVQYDTDAQLFWKQAKQLGLNAKVFIGNGAGQSSDNFGHTFGKAADGVLDTSSAISINPEAMTPEMREIEKRFVQRYKKRYGMEPDLIARLAFSSAYILFNDVIPQAGGDDPDKIRQAALSLDRPVGSTIVGWGVKFDGDRPEYAGNHVGDAVAKRQAGRCLSARFSKRGETDQDPDARIPRNDSGPWGRDEE